MRKMTKEEIQRRNGVPLNKPKPIVEDKKEVAPPVDNKMQEEMLRAQLESYQKYMKETLLQQQAQMERLLESIPQQKTKQPTGNKKLVINRSVDGLIESIDIIEY